MSKYLEKKLIEKTSLDKPEKLDPYMVDQLADYLNLMGNYVINKVVGKDQQFEQTIKESGGLQIIYEPATYEPNYQIMKGIDGLSLPQVNLSSRAVKKELSFMTILGDKDKLDGVYCGEIDQAFNNWRGFGMQFGPENRMVRVSFGDKLTMPPLTKIAELLINMVEARISYIESTLS